MKIKPKKMLAGGFLLRSGLIKSVMKGIGKDNAKVIAAKKSLSTTGKLDQLNLAQQKYERANNLVTRSMHLFQNQKLLKIKTKSMERL